MECQVGRKSSKSSSLVQYSAANGQCVHRLHARQVLCLILFYGSFSGKVDPPFHGIQMFYYSVREAPFNLSPPICGHCPNSNYTPPRTQTGTLGHFLSGAIYHFYHFSYHFLPFSLNKCHKPSGQGFRTPPKSSKCPF